MAIFTTSNGRDYEFAFERQLDGSIRPYITKQPSYGSRSDAASETHRAQDEDGRWYVAWEVTLYTVAKAKEAAAAWAKRTDYYIDTGTWKPYRQSNHRQPVTQEEALITHGNRRSEE
jgi:hypothetical protein